MGWDEMEWNVRCGFVVCLVGGFAGGKGLVLSVRALSLILQRSRGRVIERWGEAEWGICNQCATVGFPYSPNTQAAGFYSVLVYHSSGDYK